MLAVVFGKTYYEEIEFLWVYIKKAREFQKNIYFCFIDYTKAFDCVDHNKLWKILKEMGMGPDHLTCLLRNLYAGQIRSDQISRSVVSDSLRPHESQNARPPCPSPAPGVHSDSRPSSQWCHPAISSSVIPFSSCPQSLPASGQEATIRTGHGTKNKLVPNRKRSMSRLYIVTLLI